METYRVLVEGSNFLLRMQGEVKVVGFFSTFYVGASSVGVAEIGGKVEPLVLSRAKELNLDIVQGRIFSSQILIDAIFQEDSEGSGEDSGGLTLFEMSWRSKFSCFIKALYYKAIAPSRLLRVSGPSLEV